ncbi:unnamed protein product [Bursaphelenchus xylophilus]|uniref:non-specific serine/threonine protein kinase n=1 Tax=Bursaphelenchus xylophilus TaxID=6326 RepID=A0A1I7SU17_BURXY|nr:unnamed protein product [Bursaphelenchus xylophilus]CAG9107684.1 unnamed protein product [Bursaphelenchus xylophilus]
MVASDRDLDTMSARVCFREDNIQSTGSPDSPAKRNAPSTATGVPFKELHKQENGTEPPKTAGCGSKSRRSIRHYNMYFPIQGKRIRLCFNGDRFSKPVAYSISAFKTFDAFLEDVNSKVGRHAALLYGARNIFSTNGVLITALDDMRHNETYVCASTAKFVPLNYDQVGVPKWTSTLNKQSRPLQRPSVTRYKCHVKRSRQSSMPSECGDQDGLNATRSDEVPQLPNTDIVGFLGRGHSAEVFKARNAKGKLFAVKIISMKNNNMAEFVAREIELMKALRCDHIVKMFKTYEQPNVGQIIELEYIPAGDLFDYMKVNKVLDEYNCASVMSCLASALTFMHANSVVHRDIKPENLLVYFDENQLCKVKVTDLGLATRIVKGQMLFTVCGTPTYVAPEVVAKEGYSFECDSWSSGIIMYLLLAGFPPFYTQNDDQGELFDQILEAKVPLSDDYLTEVSWSAKLLLKKLLLRYPKKRLKARELLAEKWVKDPARITNADEAKAAEAVDEIDEQLQHPPDRPPSKMRRYSNPDFNVLKPGQKTVFQLHRANTQLLRQYKKVFTSVPHQTSHQSSLSDDDVYEYSDSEDGQLENGRAEFVFYRPAN